MRNVKTRNEILEKLWGRYVSQYVWNVEDLNRLLKNRHDGQLDNRKDLDYYTMIMTSIRELRVLEMQMAVSNIDWNVINREHPKKYAERLISIKFRK